MGSCCTKNQHKNVIVDNKFFIRPDTIKIKKISANREFAIRNYFYATSTRLWINIIDYLNYKDLYQVGKLNRCMFQITKSQNILLKFFKRRTTVGSTSIQLQNKTNLLQYESKNSKNFSLSINENKASTTGANTTTNITQNNDFLIVNNKIQQFNNKSKTISQVKNSPQNEKRLSLNNVQTKMNTREKIPTISSLKNDTMNNSITNNSNNLNLNDHSLHSIKEKNSNVLPFNLNLQQMSKSKISGQNIVKLYINSNNSPYIDILTKKELDPQDLSNNTGRFIMSGTKLHNSILKNSSVDDITPSFSQQEIQLTENSERIVNITNITQINISSYRRSLPLSSNQISNKNISNGRLPPTAIEKINLSPSTTKYPNRPVESDFKISSNDEHLPDFDNISNISITQNNNTNNFVDDATYKKNNRLSSMSSTTNNISIK